MHTSTEFFTIKKKEPEHLQTSPWRHEIALAAHNKYVYTDRGGGNIGIPSLSFEAFDLSLTPVLSPRPKKLTSTRYLPTIFCESTHSQGQATWDNSQ